MSAATSPAVTTPVDPAGIDAVFFDFDGVIVESNEVKIEAFRAIYEPYGEDVVAEVLAEHVRQEGVSRVVKLERFHRELLGIELDEAGLAALAQRYCSLVEEKVVACDAVPGAMAALEAWEACCPLYVVSGTPEEELRRIAGRRGLTHHFKAVYGSPRVKTDIVGKVLDEIGVAPGRALFVGDSLTDYNAAAAVGTQFLGRVPGWRRNCFPGHAAVAEDLWPLARAAGAPAQETAS